MTVKQKQKPVKFGILVGVSSDVQVEDKASIPDQIQTCRATIEQLGGEEVGCYVMDGYSRTGYDSLADAMEDIPPLKEAIQAAEKNQYDVLILDNWDRLGDLGQLVHTRYKKYRKQIYSARQSGRLHDPDTYDPYSDESAGIDMHIQAIIQQYRMNKIRRGWNIGVPNRIKKGLPPFRVPFGYNRVDKNTPPVQNEYAREVIKMKDWLLEGRPMSWIAEQLTSAVVPPPHNKVGNWHVESIRHILLNPFYAGIIAMGQKKPGVSKKGKVKRYRQRTAQSEWMRGTGLHQPLWDEDTLLAIENEFARRLKLKNYSKTVYPLAGLLRCTECKQKLIRRQVGRNGKLLPGVGCRQGEAHVILEYDRAIQMLADALHRDLQRRKQKPISKEAEMKRLMGELADLQGRRTLVQEGYEAQLYKREEAVTRIQELERQENRIQKQLDELERFSQTQTATRAVAASLQDRSVEDLVIWISEDDPAMVNHLLSTYFLTAWVSPSHEVDLELRQ